MIASATAPNTLHRASQPMSSGEDIAPTTAPTNTLHRASQPLSSGEKIAPSAAVSATPFARHDNTSAQAVPPRSGPRVAPTTIPRARTIFDAREAIKHIARAKSSAGISNPQADTPRMTAAKRRAQEEELRVSRAQARAVMKTLHTLLL